MAPLNQGTIIGWWNYNILRT